MSDVIISKGTKLGYGAVTGETRPTTYTYIPNLTGIPAMGATPTTHQVTDLDNTSHVYIKGLMDIGGNLDFPCNFTDAVITAVDTAITAEDGGAIHEWAVEFPAPISRRAYSMVINESVNIDTPITGTLSIVPNKEIEWEDIV